MHRRFPSADALCAERNIDALPFGVIELDRQGHVIAYNRAEAELSGLQPSRAIGRHFFDELAPCTHW